MLGICLKRQLFHTTTAEVASLLGLSNARVRSLLQKMAAEGVIEKIGNNRYAHYVLSQRDTSVG